MRPSPSTRPDRAEGPEPERRAARSRHAVGVWLLLVALAVLVQVVLGGVTRLTDSGLSITEWKLLLGVLPPLSHEAWLDAFHKYQQIPQFQKLRPTMTLDEFQFIYFWEWLHRLWGRLVGFFFLVPLVVFWQKGRLGGLARPLTFLFVLGGAQGLLGWIMVKSGLTELVYVSHLRLAAHFVLAVSLLAALVWYALPLVDWAHDERTPRGAPSAHSASTQLITATKLLVALTFVQLVYGGFMAGLKAAMYAPTWPTINGSWFPSNVTSLLDLVSSPLGVHFVHRTLAYLLTVAVLVWFWQARSALPRLRHALLGLVLLQVLLGITATVGSYLPGHLLLYGALHQLVGTVFAVVLVGALRLLGAAPRGA
ncbi:MAG TPA: COX15/CtaA family protein [Polyangiaceae bacterium]|nr:COX15/CtaA family protein [Polyangiaceae bacterium]